MKVAILTASSGWGGAENHTLQLARALEERGCEVVIVQLGHRIYERARSELGPRVRLESVDFGKPLEHVSLREAIKQLRPLAGDVCVFEKGDLEAGNFMLDLAARWYFRSYITIEQFVVPAMPPMTRRKHVAGLIPGVGLWWRKLYLKRQLRSKLPQKIICVSDSLRNRLVNEYRVPVAKTITIHNGVDPKRFRPRPELRERIRKSWDVPDGAFVFGAVGRHEPVKDYITAIRCFGRLVQSFHRSDIYLVLVGEGSSTKEMRAEADRIGIGSLVKFPGATDRPWNVYPGIDCFVMTSLGEGLPFALLEAMACGCVPIAMGVGGIPEVVCSPEAGWSTPPRDEAAFVAAMQAAVSSRPAELAKMSARGRERVTRCFDNNAQIDKIVRIIESEANAARGLFGPVLRTAA